MEKIVFLVTGSSGMVGSRVVRDLSRRDDARVIAVDRVAPVRELENVDYLTMDWMSKGTIEAISEISHKIDYIIHLAAVTDLNGRCLGHYDFNYLSILKVKELSDLFSVKRVVFSSTQLVKNIWLEEDAPPLTFYGESKRIAEFLISSLLPNKAVIVRLTTVWGEGHNQHYDRFIHYLRRGFYFHMGTSPVYKSYSYIGNCAYQIINICQNDKSNFKNKAFYICDPEPIEIRKYVDDICAQIGAKRPMTLPRSLSILFAMGGDALNKIGINFPFNSYRLNNIICCYIYENQELHEMVVDLPYTYESAMEEYGLWLRTKE
ncbi:MULTISPECIES: NAD-dependent epimerase/dehydratase family protein [unclassified Roseobacter]|uniref:NAD-dependent epimerase/dehydratase family protein n=1 Tax=unclassified Roseobacter TaxID=196798 RepID=UPI0030EB51F3